MVRMARALVMSVVLLAGCQVTVNDGEEEETTLTLESGTPEAHREVEQAAMKVLVAMDRGAYGRVWDEAAPSFKQAAGRMMFRNVVGGLRGMAGKPTTRTLKLSGFTNTLSDAPPGSYAMVLYTTHFDGVEFEERVVLHEMADGWATAGYFLE